LASADRDVSIEQQQSLEQGTRVSWGGIWAGVLVALGTLLLLSTLGLAVGIAANTAAGGGANAGNVNPNTVGTAAVIWSALSLLISMFLGGLASTRMGRIWDRGTGMFHGGLVWVITLGTILYLGVRGLGLMAGHSTMGFDTGGAGAGLPGGGGMAGSAATNAAAGHETSIGWSPFIISALSLLAALAGAASGLRRMLDLGRQGGSSFNNTYGGSSTNYGGTGGTGSTGSTNYGTGTDRDNVSSSSTTTTTTTTRDRDRDRDRY
jgi:hypothetical protein